jgi:hypothetical protein
MWNRNNKLLVELKFISVRTAAELAAVGEQRFVEEHGKSA